MWTKMTESLHRLWRVLHRSAGERRTEKERARFWAQVREGQEEAELAYRH